MKDLIIERSKGIYFSPSVNFDYTTGLCELLGESYLENTFEFYNQIIEWLRNYLTHENRPLVFNAKITYYNTSSSRALLDIFMLFNEFISKGRDITINWYYDPDNKITMAQEVEDFEDEAEIKMNFLPLSDQHTQS